MKLRSFRLRLALWSAFFTGIALFGFAVAVDWQIRHNKIADKGKEMRLFLAREASHPAPPADYWRHIEKVSHDLFASGAENAVIVYAQNAQNEDYQSSSWPAELTINALPWSQVPEMPVQHKPPPHFPFDRPPPPSPSSVIIHQLSTPSTTWLFGLSASSFTRIAIGVNLSIIDAEMLTMRKAFLLAVPFALLLIGIGSAILSTRALAPLQKLTATMQKISAKGLNQRIALDSEDIEFTKLISVFNAMLERLERSFLQASRFSADAAHELKTPLAILQGQIEQTMAQVETGSLVQIRLSSILDEIQRLNSISRKLLLLSLADAGQLKLHKVSFDLSQALEDLLDDAHMLAPDLTISGDITPHLTIQADATLILQVLHNLLSNAIKYNLSPANSQGWIYISAGWHQQRIEIAMSNSTCEIATLEQSRIFERFYRADDAHNRHIDGVGLGLSLSREISLAHGGELLVNAKEMEITFLLIL